MVTAASFTTGGMEVAYPSMDDSTKKRPIYTAGYFSAITIKTQPFVTRWTK